MPALPMADTYGRMTFGVACHYRHCDTNTDDVGCDMPSLTLRSTIGQMTLGVASHQLPREAHTVEHCWAWHAIIPFGKNTWSYYVRCGLKSYTLDTTYSLKTSSISCYHRVLTSHTVGRRQAWNARMSLGQQTLSDDIGQGIPLSPLDNIQG